MVDDGLGPTVDEVKESLREDLREAAKQALDKAIKLTAANDRIAELETHLAAVSADRNRWEQMHGNAIKEARIVEGKLADARKAAILERDIEWDQALRLAGERQGATLLGKKIGYDARAILGVHLPITAPPEPQSEEKP